VKSRVLVAGFATRHVAQSAYRAGYEVCAVDHFCDQDLDWYTRDRIKFDELEDLPDAIHEMSGRYQFDFLVFTSGAEDLPAILPLCGTPRNRISRFLDKLETQEFLEGLGVPVPRLIKTGIFPVMIKPRRGAGGWRNSIVADPEGLAAWESSNPEISYIQQEIVEGVPASVCCITDGSRARAVTTNEQILRGKDSAGFGFCGSITPFIHPSAPTMITLAEKIASASGCIGTIGVDFVCGDGGCYAIEVNPRFQATVDTVEAALDCNVFDLHVGACAGRLPSTMPVPRQVAVRSILFADRDITVREDLRHLAPVIADIPWPGTSFEKDQAVVSVYGQGPDRDAALGMLDKHISTVRQYMR
jgi:hypothetical protein